MKRKIALLWALLMLILSVQAWAAERTPLRVAQFPLLIHSYMTPTQDVHDRLEKLVDRSLHVPLNGTLKAVQYIPEKECWAALEDARNEAVGKVKLKDLMRPVAEKLKADLKKVYNSRGGRENLWEMVPLKIMRKNYRPEIHECRPTDITEIDTFVELITADPDYAEYPGHEEFGGQPAENGRKLQGDEF